MARKPRLHVPGGLYHVILRGNARQDIFLAPQDRLAFYELMAEGVARFGYRVHAFCLMTNHLHLALQADSLTAIAQTFGRDISTFSHAFSRIEERSRKSAAFAKALSQHLYAISQA